MGQFNWSNVTQVSQADEHRRLLPPQPPPALDRSQCARTAPDLGSVPTRVTAKWHEVGVPSAMNDCFFSFSSTLQLYTKEER